MLNIFRGLKPFQLSEFVLLATFAFIIPISWKIATYVMIALFINTFLKGVFEEGFKRNKLQYKNKLTYFIFIAYWLIFAISFLYSENFDEARFQIGKKLSFFLFPIFFLYSNLEYLNTNRIRTIMYSFTLGILTLFFVNLIWAGWDFIFNNDEIKRLIHHGFFFKTFNYNILGIIHHTYFSISTCTALAFCLVELFKVNEKKLVIYNIISIIIFIFIPFFVESRAGILCTILILFFIWCWITFIQKRKKIGIVTGGTIILLLVGGYFLFPKSIDRFTTTYNNIKTGKGDCRITIRNANRDLFYKNLLFGVGVGDRHDETMNSYNQYKEFLVSKMIPIEDCDAQNFEDNKRILLDSIHSIYENKCDKKVFAYIDSIATIDNCNYSSVKDNLIEYQTIKHSIKYTLNAHNQFTETIIAVGIIGVLLYLAMFIMPIYLWIKNKHFDIVFFSLLFTIAFNSLFESVVERQAGIMFFVFFYFILFHVAFCQNKNS